jgi:hypothetical protein
MKMLIDKNNEEEIRVGDQILIIDLSLGENRELLSEVIDIRRILGRPAYLVETESGERKLVGDHQILRIEYSE